ncbi:integral membrane protein [Talaromyces stipitatus ATCC 10500]|uniref:Integral membrane protein n=1 Tax=Talaromyces stipitatus (strain ATCC 10500 / CBS 375.48 / QM 6759 / NRRL 1006) TaxID=441959 RepID=B8MAP0_TALSN|nr:uncharacterized protein TSTA_112920 [Talaromyces stipitatus ATCC 10500]EED17464.1 integral membrane protein [Talaromyces stipitatus ATCC 10500]
MRQSSMQLLAATCLLIAVATARPDGGHSHEGGMDIGMDMGMDMSQKDSMAKAEDEWDLSYWAYGEHSASITAHIGLEVLAWCFVLPVAVMLSVAHSRFTIPTQFVFLIVNGIALFFGLIYNASTPDLYENNAHHKIGWIASSVVVAQVVIGIVYAYSGRRTKNMAPEYERATFFPVSTQNMMEHQQLYTPVHEYRWSGDSGQGTSCPTSPDEEHHPMTKPEEEEDDIEVPTPLARGWLRSAFLDRFFASRVPGLVSNKVLRALRLVYNIIDRIILPFGFIALATGGVTYGGIFKARSIFSGLAHFIKGGIFFWYGLIVLGRYMGCWANWGWSWNLKPANCRAPTGEFVESTLIFIYGSTNVFLEHLGGWGQAWSPQDLEHVSISVMFFGAGLCGMLLESKRVKKWLKQSILGTSRNQSNEDEEESSSVSFNPMPALIIFLLGMMMGGHQQKQMVSTMVHKQWGSLLSGAALARGGTYALTYIKRPTSFLPARPPTELIGAFCLISGGLIFMLSVSLQKK